LLEILPIQGILAIDIGTALLAIVPLLFARVPQPVRSTTPAGSFVKPSIRGEMMEGFRYLLKWPGLFGVVLMATMINLVISPAFSLMPLLVKNHFSGGAINLAAIESAMGFGILAGGVLLGVWGGFKRKILTSLTGLFLLGFSVILIGGAPSWLFFVAVGGAFLTGAALSLTNGPLHAILQTVVAPEMQGRIFTLVSSVATAMTPLGLAIAGPLSDAVGVQAWFIAGGFVTLLMALIGFAVPSIYHIEDKHRNAAPSVTPITEPISETLPPPR